MQGSNVPSYTWINLDAGRTYSFYVYAEKATGERSGNSNTVTVTLPPDVQAPTAPVLSLMNVGPNHATLSWRSSDDGPFIFYNVFRDGVAVATGTSATSATFSGLQPATTYTFTAQARDNGINWSPVSTLSVTTAAADAPDTTPPTAPASVWAYLDGGGTEMLIMWSPSSDNRTPQANLVYQIYVNGVHENTAIGKTETRGYGVFGDNRIEVFAIDAAGNRSAAGVFNIFIAS